MLLAVGKFEPAHKPQDGIVLTWKRFLTTNDFVEVYLDAGNNLLTLYIRPSITNFIGHEGKRDQAAMALEMAARYAEKADGTITQHANIAECKADGLTSRVLAEYPLVPLQFDKLCLGLQALFVSAN